MTWTKAYQKRSTKASQRRRHTAQERLARDRRQAQCNVREPSIRIWASFIAHEK